jgi:hypothetical protein
MVRAAMTPIPIHVFPFITISEKLDSHKFFYIFILG